MTKLEDLKPLFYKLKMKAMYEQAESMLENIETARMTHTEWIKELLEAEIVRRESNALNRRIKVAGIRYLDACMSGIDFDIDRGLDQTQILELGTCDWIRKHQNVIITGKTGCGKTWLAGALTHAACCEGFTAKFIRMPQFLKEFSATSQQHPEFSKNLRELRKFDLLVFDEWGMGQLDAINRSDLLEIIENRRGSGSILVTSVLPVKSWSDYIQDPTYADSILDRLVRNTHRIEMKGVSMRSLERYGAIVKR